WVVTTAEEAAMTEVAASQDGTELSVRRQRALAMGGPAAVERQRASGRLTARERVGLLVDPGSWHEIGLLAGAEMRRERPVAGGVRRAEEAAMTEVAASQDGTELSVGRQRALAMGGPAAVERQRASGRLTARERVGLLVDPGSWHEIGLLADAEMRRERPVAG